MLEKILEEIIDQLKEEGCIVDDVAGNRAEEIIRKYMNEGKDINVPTKENDGWIPVEERLPGTQKVLITDGEIVMRGYRRPDGTWKYGVEPEEVFSKLSSIGVIAWKPLPAPYQPKAND